MFTVEMSDTTSYLFRRSTLTLFFPSLLFWGGLLAVCISINGFESTISSWLAQELTMRVLQGVAALVWVAFSGHLLGSYLPWVTRQFEGYWQWPLVGKLLRKWRQAYYKKVLDFLNPHSRPRIDSNPSPDQNSEEAALQRDRDYEQIYYRFPLPDESDDIMPTRLGNILKNAELYSYQRYNIDAVIMWPRLYPILLKEEFIETFQKAKGAFDLLVVISFLSTLFAFASSAILLRFGGSQTLFLLCFLGGILVAHLAYLAALEAAMTYGQLLKSAFDLYKDKLIENMGYEQPKSLEKEREFWKNICQLIYRSEAQDHKVLRYKGATDNEQTCSSSTPTLPPPNSTPNDYFSLMPSVREFIIYLKSEITPWLIEPFKTFWQKRLPGEERFLLNSFVVGCIAVFAIFGNWYLQPSDPEMHMLYVPNRDLPAYHLITEKDLTTTTISVADLPKQKSYTDQDLLHHYTREALTAYQVITHTQVISSSNMSLLDSANTPLTDTIPLSIPATAAMAFNGQLAAGAVVTVWSDPLTDTDSNCKDNKKCLAEHALVLDVQKAEAANNTEANRYPYVIMLAIPKAEPLKVMAAARSGTLDITLVAP